MEDMRTTRIEIFYDNTFLISFFGTDSNPPYSEIYNSTITDVTPCLKDTYKYLKTCYDYDIRETPNADYLVPNQEAIDKLLKRIDELEKHKPD